ncbi:hypothetical protein E4U46_004180 [Claviceps purpurea]|nr:hypothetical protein E4U46_004180 [Claviceps purpurea]
MNQQNGGNALGEHLLELFLQGQERDRKLQQERDQQQQAREIDQQALQCSHQIGQQAKEKEQDALQQTQERDKQVSQQQSSQYLDLVLQQTPEKDQDALQQTQERDKQASQQTSQQQQQCQEIDQETSQYLDLILQQAPEKDQDAMQQTQQRDKQTSQQTSQQQQCQEINQETSQYLHLILQQAPEKTQQASQQTQTPAFNTRFNECQELQKPLQTVDMSPAFTPTDRRGPSSNAMPELDPHPQTNNPQPQSQPPEQNTDPEPPSKPQDQEYCTQKCLLGLIRRGFIDPKCPNAPLHTHDEDEDEDEDKAPRAPTQPAKIPKFHPVNHAEWLSLLRDQLTQSAPANEGITFQGIAGASGAFFKVVLLRYGYTVVGKGTIAEYAAYMRREGRVYERLGGIQGEYVPILLGEIDLQSQSLGRGGSRRGGGGGICFEMDREIWLDRKKMNVVRHLMLLSWAGAHLKRYWMDWFEIPWVERGVQALQAVHREGVLHGDVRWGNVLFSPETRKIMLIDFERSFVFGELGISSGRDAWGGGEEALGKNAEGEGEGEGFSVRGAGDADAELDKIRSVMLEAYEQQEQ